MLGVLLNHSFSATADPLLQLVPLIIIFELILQFPLAALIYFDGERQGIDHERYSAGILIPLGGLIVIPLYLLHRNAPD